MLSFGSPPASTNTFQQPAAASNQGFGFGGNDLLGGGAASRQVPAQAEQPAENKPKFMPNLAGFYTQQQPMVSQQELMMQQMQQQMMMQQMMMNQAFGGGGNNMNAMGGANAGAGGMGMGMNTNVAGGVGMGAGMNMGVSAQNQYNTGMP